MGKRIGLIVNPIAGMGGSVGLKGTDGEMIDRARELGANPVTPERTHAFLEHIEQRDELQWFVAPGAMGMDHLAAVGLVAVPVGELDREGVTTSEDTRRIAAAMADAGVELLVFVGGDGTARDICDTVGVALPVVAVPAGVKVYSGAFALSPRAAAQLVEAFAAGADLTEGEVLDIDEEAFRANRLEARHYGLLLVPNVPQQLQPGKEGSHTTPDTLENKRDLAADFVDAMDAGCLYLLGPGTTVAAIAEALDVEKTLLGIDALYDGQVVGRDLNERQILAQLDGHARCAIVVTPLGGNGFIFGRGNKPFTPEVIRRVGSEHILVVATEQKAREVGVLRVDTGDLELDAQLSGYREVMIGYGIARVMKVRAD
jgi:predicted polyphosphate/ATP-dependent NAD kinase